MTELKEVSTCQLAEELEQREEVKTLIAEPYQDISVTVNGPAAVLIVTD